MISRNKASSFIGTLAVATFLSLLPTSPAGAAPSCGGKEATILGTDRSDDIHGTPGNDVIITLKGNDDVMAAGGNDTICSGPGADEVNGNDGNDRIVDFRRSHTPRDELHGGDGDDFIKGPGVGGPGNDRLIGTRRGGGLSGGNGDDVLRWMVNAGGGSSGGAGNDRLIGGAILWGGVGNDELIGDHAAEQSGPYNDWLDGGPGADTIDGGSGLNCLEYHREEEGVVVNLADGSISGPGGDTHWNIDGAIGTAFDDIFLGTEKNESFFPTLGDDTVEAGGGTDVILFTDTYPSLGLPDRFPRHCTPTYFDEPPMGSGITLDLTEGNATGRGQDTLSGIEHAVGTHEQDTLKGNHQRNYLIGLNGNDSVFGYGDDDLLYGGSTTSEIYSWWDSADGGEGEDECHAGAETGCEI